MRVRISIFTILIVALMAGNVFAATYDLATDFIGWTSSDMTGPSGGAADMYLTFSSGGWAVDGSPSANPTGGGSVYGNVGVTPAIDFNYGANEFYFTYTAPVYVTVTMADANAFFPAFKLNYAEPYGDFDIGSTTNTNNTITFLLDGSTYWDGVTGEWLDPGFGFYANDHGTYLGIESIAFSSVSSNPDFVVELTNFHYNPTATPIPGAAWLLGSGLIGLVGLRRFRA